MLLKKKKKGDRHYYLVYVWHTFLKFPTITGTISALLVVKNVEMLAYTGHWCELVFQIIHCYLLLFITCVLQFLGPSLMDQVFHWAWHQASSGEQDCPCHSGLKHRSKLLVSHAHQNMSLVSRNAEAGQYLGSAQEIKILICAFTTTSLWKLCILYHCKIKSLSDVWFYSLLQVF